VVEGQGLLFGWIDGGFEGKKKWEKNRSEFILRSFCGTKRKSLSEKGMVLKNGKKSRRKSWNRIVE